MATSQSKQVAKTNSKQSITLAEALLLRKELNSKVEQLKQINVPALFQQKVTRKNVTENVDELTMTIPKLSASQVTAEYDHAARRLRLVDAAIQQANWNTELSVDQMVLTDYVAPEVIK